MKQDIIPDVFNSRNERVILELPNYSYYHSSQTQDNNESFFLGRRSLLRKLKNLISSAASKTGVYLVSGNRGVGKSRLVEEVIKETSLRKFGASNQFAFLLIAFILTLGVQYVSTQEWGLFLTGRLVVKIIFAISLFFIIGHFSKVRTKTGQYEYPRGRKVKKDGTDATVRTRKTLKSMVNLYGLWHSLEAALRDCLILPNKSAPFLRTQNVLKLIWLILVIEIAAEHSFYTHFQLYIIYIYAVSAYFYVTYARHVLIKAFQRRDNGVFKGMRFKEKDISLAEVFDEKLKWLTLFVVAAAVVTAAISMHRVVNGDGGAVTVSLCGIAVIILTVILILYGYVARKTLEKNASLKLFNACRDYFFAHLTPLFQTIDHYIKNANHVYLKINFGHEVLNECDILRLITRTLTTAYRRFRLSLIHTLLWRILALTLLFSATYFFYKSIYRPDIQPWLESYCFYANSSQIYFSGGYDKQLFLSEFLNDPASNNIDRAVNRMYCYILNIPAYFMSKGGYRIDYNHTPVNYVWWLIFLLFYFLGCLLLRLNIFISHHTVRMQLRRLNENITYSVEREINLNGGDKKAAIGIRKKRTRFIADAREIEKELQHILENVQRIPSLLVRPDFIIVFDELDKVSPETVTSTQESGHKEKIFSSNSASDRQAVILKLLSNMKYFLSTANAKFIFIAGREMYDMYLADIADRNNYFGSIFNDVFFVPSLLTDVKSNKKQYDITTLVEEYVCRHLIPEGYPNAEYNLKEYIRYLDDSIYRDSEDFGQQVAMKKQKIVATLQQFIIYLAHTSKGAPKKMVQVFESFIGSYDNNQLEDRFLVVKRYRNSDLYLNFDYYAQYTIGMTSYLMSPVLNRLSDANIQEHSDKLLVSSLHFVDYMMKFHDHNFSWRSIDISPEVIEVNRSPVLKAIVNDIISLFEQIHFHKPIIGLFEFKFDALLAQEIFFLSKMDERFSAQFNFSLDESLILKEFYKKLLKEKQAEYEKYDKYGGDYYSSIASLQIVLGDLHFLDDELDVAALHYKDGLYLLQKQLEKDKDMENLEIFYLFIRNQLKLAYLYEKRKQYAFTYLLYGDLTSLLVQYRNFDLESKGIGIRKEGEDFIMVKQKDDERSDPYHKNVETALYAPLKDAYIYEREPGDGELPEDGQGIRKESAKIRRMQFEELSPVTQRILFKNMTFEGLQLIYLPLLAKLQILEKCSLVGILEKDIRLTEQEFGFLTRTINHSEVKILAADFYSKIGDILFYKNKVFSLSKVKNGEMENKKIEISHYPCYYYKRALIALVKKTGEEEMPNAYSLPEIFKEKADYIESKLSVRYRSMMAKVLSNLGDTYFQAQEEQCLSCGFNASGCGAKPAKGKPEPKKDFWKCLVKFIISVEEDNTMPNFIREIDKKGAMEGLSNIELALFSYALSMKFYKKANQNKHYAFQIEKILNCLKYCLRYGFYGEEIREFFKRDYDTSVYINLEILVNKAIRSLYNAYDNGNMLEIAKRKADFGKMNRSSSDNQDTPLHYIQVDSEVSRIRIIAKELELELEVARAKEMSNPDLKLIISSAIVRKLFAGFITSPYHTNYSVSARVQRLRVKVGLNREAFKMMRSEVLHFYIREIKDTKVVESIEKKYNENIYFRILLILYFSVREKRGNLTEHLFGKLKNDGEDVGFYSIIEMLIADSIFCLDEILRLIKTAGDSYLFNHSFFAAIYDRLSIWTARYETLLSIKDYCDSGITDESCLPKKLRCALQSLREIVTITSPVDKSNPLDLKEIVGEKGVQLIEEMRIEDYLRKFLGSDFKEQLSSHYYREQALAHYYKTLDAHNGGRSYLNQLEQMYFIKGDYDDVTSHFNVALERFLVNNSQEIQKRIEVLKEKGALSTVYNMNNYFEKNRKDN